MGGVDSGRFCVLQSGRGYTFGAGAAMAVPTEDELTDAIADATRRAVADLFREHPEDFYYCSLITTGEAHPPVLAAWSRGALTAAAEAADADDARWGLKWSYADSPYFGFGDAHFGEVRRCTACGRRSEQI